MAKIELMCFSTARVPMRSSAAMAALLIPRVIARSTSVSLGVGHPSGERVRVRTATSRSTTFGSITDTPLATARMAPAS